IEMIQIHIKEVLSARIIDYDVICCYLAGVDYVKKQGDKTPAFYVIGKCSYYAKPTLFYKTGENL
ncbi:MAG: hypothetical protein RSA77_10135, partial [Clostridium sp.]